MLKIVYSDRYLKYHFGPGHPFWPERAEKFIELLRKKNFKFDLVDAPKAKDSDILLVHTKDYLEKVKKLAKVRGYLSVDTQVNPDNLEAAYYSVGGTIKAFEIALKEGLAVNTLGGLHHAETNNSSGFCIFNDHAIAIRKLQNAKRNTKYAIRKAAVLDVDVHAGNGTQEIFYSDPSVLTISIHQDPTFFYPGTGFSHQKGAGKGKGFNINYPLPSGMTEKEYLPVLNKALVRIKKFKPDVLVVVFGADTYKGDPLAGFKLELETYGMIGHLLKNLRTEELKDTPQVILFAGGYSSEVPELWWELVRNLV